MAAAWKSAIAKAQAPFAHLLPSKSEDPHPLILSTFELAYEHLRESDLEYLCNEADAPHLDSLFLDPEQLLVQGLLREQLIKNVDDLTRMYIRDFSQFNVHRAMNQWTVNELCFVTLALANYVIKGRCALICGVLAWRKEIRTRTLPAKDVLQDLMNARTRLAYAMSRHHHLVSGVPFLTAGKLKERNEKTRTDVLNPADFKPVEWEQKVKESETNKREEEQRKAFLSKVVLEGKERAKRSRARLDRDELPETEEEIALRFLGRMTLAEHGDNEPYEPDPFWSHNPPGRYVRPGRQQQARGDEPGRGAKAYPTKTECDMLMDEVSYFIAIYYQRPAALRLLFQEFTEVHAATPLTLSPDAVKLRNTLTNSTPEESAHGELWKTDIETYPLRYVTFASQFFAQVYAERYWSARFPCQDVNVAQVHVDAIDDFVASRLVLGVQEGVIEETRHHTFDEMLPIGSWNMMSRIRPGVGSNRRDTFFQYNGPNATDEIYEQINTAEALQAVGFNTSHPLYDYVVMAMIQNASYMDDGQAGVLQRCIIDVNQLVRRGKDLDTTQLMGEKRKPLIVRILGEWRVHDQGVWHRPLTEGVVSSRFAAVWILYLSLLKLHHGFSLEDGLSLAWMEELLYVQP